MCVFFFPCCVLVLTIYWMRRLISCASDVLLQICCYNLLKNILGNSQNIPHSTCSKPSCGRSFLSLLFLRARSRSYHCCAASNELAGTTVREKSGDPVPIYNKVVTRRVINVLLHDSWCRYLWKASGKIWRKCSVANKCAWKDIKHR